MAVQNFLKKARQFLFLPEDPVLEPMFRRDEAATHIAPFALPVLAGFLLLFVSISPNSPPQFSAGFVACFVAVIALFSIALFAVSWEHVPRSVEVLPPMVLLLLIHLMRQNSRESFHFLAPLTLLPLFWISLYGTRLQLLFGLSFALVLGTLSSPNRNMDPVALRFQMLAVIVAPIICFTTQSLVRRVRFQAKQLESLVCTDSLTGIPNRRSWDDELTRSLARAKRRGEALCVAMVDLDHFKAYNDTYGHQSGDSFLRGSAIEWKKTLRACDFLARYGGEEFAVILPACPLHEALIVLERLRHITPGGQTCSVGVALWNENESSWSLVERADEALYAAKKAGRNRIESAKELPSTTVIQERQASQVEPVEEVSVAYRSLIEPLESAS